MKISDSWLRSYIPTELPASHLADILSETGLEVEDIFTFESHQLDKENIVIGFVEEIGPHPKADKLRITQVNVGTGENLQIICGAPNVAKGQKVVVALIGATLTLPDGASLKIKKAKLRGIASAGMICSSKELGIGSDHSGILVLDSSAEIGMRFCDYLEDYTTDTVYEIGLTPNRTDAFCHFGVARDLAAALKQPLKNFPHEVKNQSTTTDIAIQITDADACPRFSGLKVSGIEVKESPSWLRNKLKSIDLNPVNNIVDITNFVMMEMGQPLHAYDLRTLENNTISAGYAAAGDQLTLLNGQKVTLSAKDIVISSSGKTLGLAGIMGGKNTGIQPETTEIFIESAYFNPIRIRQTAKRLKLSSDAAFRYERGTDPNATITALERATYLIKEIFPNAQVEATIDQYPSAIKPQKIKLRFAYVNQILGTQIPKKEMVEILENLGYKILRNNDAEATVEVPTYRVDVTRPIDLVEEVVRIYSLNKVPVSAGTMTFGKSTHHQKKETFYRSISENLVNNGFFELKTTPFSKQNEVEGEVKLQNPIITGEDALQNSLLEGGLSRIAYNFNRQQDGVRFFELAKTYNKKSDHQWLTGDKNPLKADTGVTETTKMGLWMSGLLEKPHWRQAHKEQKVDFFDLKYFLEGIFQKLNFHPAGMIEKRKPEGKYAYSLIYHTEEELPIAEIGLVHPKITDAYDIKTPVFYAELDVALVYEAIAHKELKYKSIGKFPAVERDLSFLLPKKVAFASLKEAIFKMNQDWVRYVELFDVYEGENLPSGQCSYAIRIKIEDQEKTLKDKQVNKLMDKITATLTQKFEADIRK